MGGFLPITHQEMLAMFVLEQSYPEPFEIELIRSFDRVFQTVQGEQVKKDHKKNSSKK